MLLEHGPKRINVAHRSDFLLADWLRAELESGTARRGFRRFVGTPRCHTEIEEFRSRPVIASRVNHHKDVPRHHVTWDYSFLVTIFIPLGQVFPDLHDVPHWYFAHSRFSAQHASGKGLYDYVHAGPHEVYTPIHSDIRARYQNGETLRISCAVRGLFEPGAQGCEDGSDLHGEACRGTHLYRRRRVSPFVQFGHEECKHVCCTGIRRSVRISVIPVAEHRSHRVTSQTR